MSPQRMAMASSMALVEELLQSIQTISAIGDEVRSHKKSCWNLVRRVKLLSPLFEEIRDMKSALPPAAVVKFQELKNAFTNAKSILGECRDGSRLYMILERDDMIQRFQALTSDLSRALDGLPLNLLAVSDEIQEQAELVQAQLKRAKAMEDPQDELLRSDLQSFLRERKENATDIVIDLLMKFGLNTLPAISKELMSLEKVRAERWEASNYTTDIDQLTLILKKLIITLHGSDSELDHTGDPCSVWSNDQTSV